MSGKSSAEGGFGFPEVDIDEFLDEHREDSQPAAVEAEVKGGVEGLLASIETDVDIEIVQQDGSIKTMTKVSLLRVPNGFFENRTVDFDLKIQGCHVCSESQIMPTGDGAGAGATPNIRIARPADDNGISFEVSDHQTPDAYRPPASSQPHFKANCSAHGGVIARIHLVGPGAQSGQQRPLERTPRSIPSPPIPLQKSLLVPKWSHSDIRKPQSPRTAVMSPPCGLIVKWGFEFVRCILKYWWVDLVGCARACGVV